MEIKNTTVLYIAIALFFAILAVTVGVAAYQVGQQASNNYQTDTAGMVPATDTPPLPPPIVTNTPSATSTPIATQTSTPTPSPTPTFTPSPTPTPIVVITHIKELGKLETAEYGMRTVIDLGNEPSNLWEQLVGSDELLLVAEGEVVAGFDLEKIVEGDIIAQGSSVEINLPAPEILYSRIDNERTQVYERKTGIFVRPDISLESRARQLAEESLVEWAIERGIHDKAELAGRTQLENLLRALGFTSIVINVKETEL